MTQTEGVTQARALPPPGEARAVAAGLHGLFVLLVLIPCVRTLLSSEDTALPLTLTVLLLAVYALGVRRGWARRPEGTPGAVQLAWLLAIVLVWVVLVHASSEYSWVAFALYLLVLHLLDPPWGEAAVLALVAVVIAAQAMGRTGALGLGQVVGPLVGALVAVGVIRAYQRLQAESEDRRRLVAALVAAQDDLLAVNDELAATQRQAGALAERARLARDIHDTLAQGFSSIVLLSRAGLAEHPDAAARRRELLRQIEQVAGDNLTEARRVVHALAPSELTEAPLPAALGRLLTRFTDQSGVAGELRVDGDPAPIPTAHEVALLRLAQGALANVRSHADAHRVALTLAYLPDATTLDVVDDGRGFDPQAWEAAPRGGDTGFGLRAMRERLADVGGGLVIESEPGEGVAVSASIPLPGGQATEAVRR